MGTGIAEPHAWRARALVAGIACAVIVAVVPAWRQQRAVDHALSVAQSGDLAAGQRRLRDARTLGPQQRPQLREAQILVLMKRPAEARETLAPLLKGEPDHLEAWQTMRLIARALGDDLLQVKADQRVAMLDPRAD